jgi:protein SCO1
MKPTPPATDTPSPSARLTKREFLSTLTLGLAIAGVVVAIAFLPGKPQPPAPASPATLDRPRQLIPFSLTERSGRPVTHTDLAGKFLVVDFVFTSCSLKCRVVNDRMAEIQRLVADAPDVRLVSLTVDPRSDTPAVLAKFANSFNADTNRWLFLTGDKAEVYRLIETSFISKSPDLEQIIPGGFASTDRIMLVEPNGNVCASFNGLKSDVATNVGAEIKKRRNGVVSRSSTLRR